MLTTDLKDHVALVTGASGGIGKATCFALATLGCSIAVHYNSDRGEADAIVKQLTEEKGVHAQAFHADLTDYEQVRRLHKEVHTSLGHPTILFNNAGLTHGKSGVSDVKDISVEDFEQTWRGNCGSAFLLAQLCIPEMEDRQFGRLIFNSSVAAFTGGVVGPHYAYVYHLAVRRKADLHQSSSKSALHGLIHWLSQAYCKKGITVNGVAPALIEGTKMLPGKSEELAKKIPMGVLGRPEEVAETVLWMVKTGYITNKVVGVDGGMFAQ